MRTLPIVGGIINIKQNNFDMHHLFILLMVCMILSIISEPIGDFCIDGIFKNVNLLGPRMLLNFTNGDRDRIEEIEKKKKTFRSRASFFLITILVSFGINIFSTWIYPYLEKM
ncbi:hypothetical protein [Acetobacter tropicalis]|uniref:hypothetical protein n=1 Tax=Acetobacter tropicalis TaxID=104102 RepID=UPI00130526C2|nr:hypothetical protein [Acetobacter tropicalis]